MIRLLIRPGSDKKLSATKNCKTNDDYTAITKCHLFILGKLVKLECNAKHHHIIWHNRMRAMDVIFSFCTFANRSAHLYSVGPHHFCDLDISLYSSSPRNWLIARQDQPFYICLVIHVGLTIDLRGQLSYTLFANTDSKYFHF